MAQVKKINKYTIPRTYNEAIRTPQAEEWKEAVLKEFNLMHRKHVYTLVNKSKVAKNKIVQSKWLFSVELDSETGQEIFMARIVAKGNTQKKGINYIETYAPTATYENVRLVLSLSAMKNWDILQVEATDAFLNSKPEYDIYMEAPDATTRDSNLVWKLNRTVYGLKQSARVWYFTVRDFLKNNGFKNSDVEPCLFWKKEVMLILYADEFLICGKNKSIKETLQLLENNFEMKVLGYPKNFIGITIRKTDKGIGLSSKDQIDRIETEFDFSYNEKKVNTPLVKGFEKKEDNSPPLNKKEHSIYRSLIGKLLFLANSVRVDIAFAVSYLSRFLENPTTYRMKGAKRLLQYVVQTRNFKLHYHNKIPIKIDCEEFVFIDERGDEYVKPYPKVGEFDLVCLTSSNWVGDISDKKSQFGHMILINGNIINWQSKRQRHRGSSSECEYIVLADGLTDALGYRAVSKELSLNVSFINMLVEHQSALALYGPGSQNKRVKDIDVKYHFVIDYVDQEKAAKLNHIYSEENIAYLLTKTLIEPTHIEWSKLINN